MVKKVYKSTYGKGRKYPGNIPFPHTHEPACQLKWSHSTIFLPRNETSSCHRVDKDPIPDNFNFHNTRAKVTARQQMLDGVWPDKGCQHCRVIEQAGGTSDRQIHLHTSGLGPPPEFDRDINSLHVTPRWVEVYFSNLCNLSCIYCGEYFSSTWATENKKYGNPHGHDSTEMRKFYNTDVLSGKFFNWFKDNGKHLYNLMILGGEPFTQPQSDTLIDFLYENPKPQLTVTFFSNLTVDHERMKARFGRLQDLKDKSFILDTHIVGSLDCWGPEAEYVRFGLNLDLFEQNLEYLLYETDSHLSINSAWCHLATKTYPQLVNKINKWNHVRRVYHSLMQAAGEPYMHPGIFGPWILEQGFSKAIRQLNTHEDIILEKTLEYFYGIEKSIAASEVDSEKIELQRKLYKFLNLIDDRRNTDFTKMWPEINEKLLESVK